MKHLIKLALVLLASTAAYYVYCFTAQVADWRIALAAAGSLVATYVGLAFADVPPHQQQRARAVAIGAMLIESLYGFLYVFSVQSPDLFTPPLPISLSVPLALLHGASVSILAFAVSLFVVHERQAVLSTPASDVNAAVIDALRAVTQRLDTVAPPVVLQPPALTDAQPTLGEVPEIVKWRDVDGLSFHDIGLQLGVSRQAAQQRYSKAKGAWTL